MASMACLLWSMTAPGLAAAPIDLQGRLELFTDDFIIEHLAGDAKKLLQKPQPAEVVFTTDAPWEGNLSGSYSIFQDGDRYRMYYRGAAVDVDMRSLSRPEVTCLAESTDGIHWTRPVLNLHEWGGSKENNIVWTSDTLTHNMAVFKDDNPEAAPNTRYKAIVQTDDPRSYTSADGLHWTQASEQRLPTIGPYDSENIAFWDSARAEYRLYWILSPITGRKIVTATSKDFSSWENQADLTYPGKPVPTGWKDAFHLSTGAIQPYFRAPHLLVGFPAQLLFRHAPSPLVRGEAQPLLMTSRDGIEFTRWDEPVIPVTAPEDRDKNRSNIMAWGILQLPGAPDEISVYATENYYRREPTRLRRFIYRLDGFVCVSAGPDGGELITKPLRSTGNRLTVNYKANNEGVLRVELQDENGKALEGFTFNDCDPLTGDSVNAVVRWKGKPDLNGHASKALRIRFLLKNAELYSIKL